MKLFRALLKFIQKGQIHSIFSYLLTTYLLACLLTYLLSICKLLQTDTSNVRHFSQRIFAALVESKNVQTIGMKSIEDYHYKTNIRDKRETGGEGEVP